MIVYVVTCVYKKQIAGRDNSCVAVYLDKKKAETAVELAEQREDIHAVYIQEITVCE